MQRRTFLGAATAAAAAPALVQTALAQTAPQVVKAGSTPTGAPFTFLDTSTNKIAGWMVDFIAEIGKKNGFEVQIEPMLFSALIGSVTSGRIDIIVAAMLATPARREVINFTQTVYEYGEGLFVVKTDAREYAGFEDLRGQVVGVQAGTAYLDAARKFGGFSDVKVYDTIADIMRDVNVGRLKAGFGDFPIVAYNLQQNRFPEVRLVRGYKPSVTGGVAIGVRKDREDLLRGIEASVAAFKADGTLNRILTKWGLGA